MLRTRAAVASPSPSSDVPKISISKVRKVFEARGGGEVHALEEITLEVRRGEFVCLLGPSGCGKSTLLNMVAGLDEPDAGTISVDGRPVGDAGPDRAVLFQEPALFPWMSVEENIRFALKYADVPKAEMDERTDRWLRKVHLSRFAKARPHELSGGMRQRAALARALACDPSVLLADEPFAALDAQTRELLQAELQQVCAEAGMTVLFVTHNVREAAFLADRVLLMSAPPGSVVQIVPVTLARPRSLDDPGLQSLIAAVHAHLMKEVNKVAQAEMGS